MTIRTENSVELATYKNNSDYSYDELDFPSSQKIKSLQERVHKLFKVSLKKLQVLYKEIAALIKDMKGKIDGKKLTEDDKKLAWKDIDKCTGCLDKVTVAIQIAMTGLSSGF